MASITSWNRLEPRTRSDTLPGVEARVHDPLWMLARQWQFGEFLAEDTGSPTAVRARGTWSVIAEYHGGATTMSVPTFTPLETMVQRENVVVSLSDRLTAGLHFLRLLGSRLAAQYRLWYAKRFPISTASVTELDEARRIAQLSSRLVPDGLALFLAFGAQASSALPPALTAEDEAAITNALRLFSKWFEVEYQSPPSTAWEAELLRYRFDLTAPIHSAPSAADGTILTAAGNTGGHLDWYMFDASTAAPVPPSVPPEEIDIKVIPVPARFAGMPTARWWEFEDGTIDFGAIDTAPEDIGRLMLAEFALVHGNDFFVVPLELPVGALCRVTLLEVSNTFGELLEIRDVATQSWRLFRLSKDQRSAGLGEATDLFFLPPSLGATFEGTPIEEVNLLRDEMANMAWAVERVVEGPTGPINRTERENAKRVPDTHPASTSASGAPPVLEYRLSTSVPANWYPLVPEQQQRAVGGSSPREVALRLARLPAEGQVLKELGDTRLHEEELPRTGTMVARKWKYARWIDGSTHVWIGRTRTLGRGEGSSGLRFDVVELKR